MREGTPSTAQGDPDGRTLKVVPLGSDSIDPGAALMSREAPLSSRGSGPPAACRKHQPLAVASPHHDVPLHREPPRLHGRIGPGGSEPRRIEDGDTPCRLRVTYRRVNDSADRGFTRDAGKGLGGAVVGGMLPGTEVGGKGWLAQVDDSGGEPDPECGVGHGLDALEIDGVLEEFP